MLLKRFALLQRPSTRQRRPCAASSNGSTSLGLYSYNIHGRHVEVTEELESYVKQRLQTALDKFTGAEYLEGEGGIKDVDVRLM